MDGGNPITKPQSLVSHEFPRHVPVGSPGSKPALFLTNELHANMASSGSHAYNSSSIGPLNRIRSKIHNRPTRIITAQSRMRRYSLRNHAFGGINSLRRHSQNNHSNRPCRGIPCMRRHSLHKHACDGITRVIIVQSSMRRNSLQNYACGGTPIKLTSLHNRPCGGTPRILTA